MSVVLDTNVVIYLLGGRLAEALPADDYVVSVITEIEMLSYPSLTTEEEQRVGEFLATVSVAGLSPDVRDATIRLRRAHRLKLPDAIIAATALAFDAELLTSDARLVQVPDIRARQPRLSDV